MPSIYDKIKTVRKPRVQISYELEEGGATVKKELPFVVGVLGDFSGNPTKPLKNFKKRKFINIYGDNFNEVMEGMCAGVEMRVKNKIKNDDSEMSVRLSFKNMDDFSPAKIAENVEPLKRLLKVRANLRELLSKAERSEILEKTLENILQSQEQLQAIAEEFKNRDKQPEQQPEEEPEQQPEEEPSNEAPSSDEESPQE
jgi:type VI secretion system protein ImpB